MFGVRRAAPSMFVRPRTKAYGVVAIPDFVMLTSW